MLLSLVATAICAVLNDAKPVVAPPSQPGVKEHTTGRLAQASVPPPAGRVPRNICGCGRGRHARVRCVPSAQFRNNPHSHDWPIRQADLACSSLVINRQFRNLCTRCDDLAAKRCSFL
jgi:hypothetical protein